MHYFVVRMVCGIKFPKRIIHSVGFFWSTWANFLEGRLHKCWAASFSMVLGFFQGMPVGGSGASVEAWRFDHSLRGCSSFDSISFLSGS